MKRGESAVVRGIKGVNNFKKKNEKSSPHGDPKGDRKGGEKEIRAISKRGVPFLERRRGGRGPASRFPPKKKRVSGKKGRGLVHPEENLSGKGGGKRCRDPQGK